MNDTFESYNIIQKLHDSPNSRVFRAAQKSDGRSVIVKILANPQPSPKEVMRFKREYETIRKLRHDGIVQAYDFERIQNNFLIVFEDIGAVSLRTHFQTNVVEIPQFLRFALQLVRVIGYLHGESIIHKDINPANIIWNPETDQLKLIDFGICTELRREGSNDPTAKQIEGTIAYVSPEQTGRMNRFLDYRSDFYSLGVTLYELLTGHLPFKDSDVLECIHSHIAKLPPDPRILNAKIPEGIVAIISKLMAKDPEDRYQSAKGLIADLEHCRAEWERSRDVSPFPLARKDVYSHFAIPQKLYGREVEITTILEVFDEAATQGSRFLTVSGFSGIGKSALINEVNKPIAAKKGFFIAGKFDQFTRNVPFSALIYALKSLVIQLQRLPPSRLQSFATALKQKLGPNGQVITEMAPEFISIIGPLPPLPQLDPEQARNRCMLTLTAFIKAIASEQHPLVLFLDDMQWADHGTLNVLEYLLTGETIRGLFIIAAYRHNEVSEGHPFQISLDLIRKVRSVHGIHLKPLTENNVKQIVADTLHVDAREVEKLAQIVHRKTEGNPFFTSEFLIELKDRKHISFDSLDGRWRWDLEQASAIEVADNVVDMLIDKMKTVPPKSLELLQIASCIGSQFSLKNLSVIQAIGLRDVASALWDALNRDVIIPIDDNYRLLGIYHEENSEIVDLDFDVVFRFRHDRLQQACAAQMKEVDRKRTHLLIARLLREAVENSENKEADLDSQVIDIVRHYNEAADLIVDRPEQLAVAGLNLKAAAKARQAVAYQPAFEMVKAGVSLLKAQGWQEDHRLAFDLHHEYVQCAYLSGLFDEAEKASQLLLEQAKTRLEKINILLMQSIQYNAISRKEDSVRKGLQGLALLGVRIPEKPSLVRILIEVIRSKVLVGKRSTTSLEEAPKVSDIEKNLQMRYYNVLTPAAFQIGASELFALISLKSVNITLRHGNFPESAYTYVVYGMLLVHVLGQKSLGLLFGDLGTRLYAQYGHIEGNKGNVFTIYSILLSHWYHRPKESLQYFKTAIASCQEAGELYWTAAAALLVIPSTLHDDNDLEGFMEETRKYLEIIHQTKVPDVIKICSLIHGYFRAMRGLTSSPLSFSFEGCTEAELVRGMKETRFYSGIQIYHTFKSMAAFLIQDYVLAEKHSRKAMRFVDSSMGLATFHLARTYDFFIKAARYGDYPRVQRMQVKRRLKQHFRFISKWAKASPGNFQHIASLMEAELARIHQEKFPANLALYEKAIAEAQRINDYFTGLAYELAGAYSMEKGMREGGQSYLSKAVFAFERFGALPKARHLFEKYNLSSNARSFQTQNQKSARSASNGLNPATSTDQITHTTMNTTTMIDHLTALKTAQSLASEIKIENLLTKIMEALIQNTGAEKGCLIMQNSATRAWEIRVACYSGQEIDFLAESIVGSELIPTEIVQKVIDRNESIILDDASKRDHYSDLPYIKGNQVRSVLSLPLTHKGKVIGVIYLENKLASGVFTESRVDFIKLLAAHAAVALENSQFYKDLEDKVTENTRDVQSMLTHLRQGIMTIVGNGRIHPKYSEHLAHIMQTDEIADRDAVSFIFAHSDIDSDRLTQIRSVLNCVGENRITYEMNEHILARDLTKTMPDGSVKFLELDWAAICENDDTIQKILVTIRDATSLRQVEEQAKRQEHELQIIGELLKISNEKWTAFHEATQIAFTEIEDILQRNQDSLKDHLNRIYISYHTIKGHCRSLGLSRLLAPLNDSEETLSFIGNKKQWEKAWLLADIDRCKKEVALYQSIHASKLSDLTREKGCNELPWRVLKEKISQHFPAENSRLELYATLASCKTLNEITEPIAMSLSDLARELHKETPVVSIDAAPVLFHTESARILADILIHLFRNSLDHGIEVPSFRTQSGKPEAGRISLSMKTEEGELVFIYGDDGAGLDLDELHRKAIRMGIVAETAILSKHDQASLIFHPELSTTTHVTCISGRGVGMNAVQQLIQQHGGDVEIIFTTNSNSTGRQPFVLKFHLPDSMSLEKSHALIIAAA